MNTIALVGNPNSGKTTLFNALTGSNQHVGNWPGVTVEKKEGNFTFDNILYNVVDLPGTYSIGAFSEDEIIVRDYIIKGNSDVVINVVDSTNIERNLYLTTQLLEMGVKVVVALNMIDEARAKNIEVDIEVLEKKLGVPIVATIASRRQGIEDLIEKAVELIEKDYHTGVRISYGTNIDREINRIKKHLNGKHLDYPSQWIAVKLLEQDDYILKEFQDLAKAAEKLGENWDDFRLEIIDKRYEFISGITNVAVKVPEEPVETLTDKIDNIITHRYFGLPIFAIIMLVVFQLTFTIGEDLFGELTLSGIEYLGEIVEGFLVKLNASSWIISFVTEGLFGGVGVVLEFIPLIIILYMLMGFLEDSGYMARAAYIMDNIMRALGLQGKTFISMIVGFGCNVPGVMSTRTLDNKKDRMIAILINPFMSCGAKLPIYLVFIAAFFPKNGGLILFLIYLLGILMALLMGKIFSTTLFKGETSNFIMELPPYRWPTLRNVFRNMWDNVSDFLKRAGTTILAVISILWILAVLPAGVEPYSQQSLLGQIGIYIAPIFKPAGLGAWQTAVGLFAGIAAKEAVIATLGMVYAGVSEGAVLVTGIRQAFTPLTAVAFMAMTLLYTPCVATLATIKKETNSYKWAIFSAIYTFAIGWLMAVVIFQLGNILGFS